ncbi:hypothetical protein [Massilia psychrophila]|uniref:Metallo-beta-lactamase domain-containing protein n=1 Tax=Massilia psychrophila TaxID=1603353 RepID=A0A2G8SWM6_9BURK|nr:hypothetical protein [Massilia psychrophila]PIL38142.1 hypothetical protein CR103_19590 [Massilia psychrophila]GGE86089.1 hypothetical protein GCM10008020_33720 [Massilia psychrophila]
MDGRDGVRMMQLVAPRHAIPIHYNEYGVFKSPLSDFQREVAGAGLTGKVAYLNHGQRYRFGTAAPCARMGPGPGHRGNSRQRQVGADQPGQALLHHPIEKTAVGAVDSLISARRWPA